MSATDSNLAMRFLVIGCGSIGRRHIGNLLALDAGEILAFDLRGDRRSEVASQYGVRVVDNLDHAWDAHPEVALVTAPTRQHVPLGLQAAEHGCHLFIEKPLSDQRDRVDQLLSAVQGGNLITLVGCNMRFHPGLMKVKKLVDEEAIGRVVAARVEAGQYLPDWHPSEDYRQGYSARRDLGGGVILGGIHEIDYLRWILGEVKTVACFAGKLSHLEIDTEDTAAILLRFNNHAIGEVHLDYVQRAYGRSCHLIGEEGTIRWDYNEGSVRWYSAKSRTWNSFSNPKGWEPNQMYVDELKHFLRCLAQKEQPVLDVFEGARLLEVALAAKASAETGQFVRLQA